MLSSNIVPPHKYTSLDDAILTHKTMPQLHLHHSRQIRLTTVLDQVLGALDSYEADAMPVVVKFVS